MFYLLLNYNLENFLSEKIFENPRTKRIINKVANIGKLKREKSEYKIKPWLNHVFIMKINKGIPF